MITDDMVLAAKSMLCIPMSDGLALPLIRSALEAAEAAAWLPYDPDTIPQEDVLLYWPAAGVDGEDYCIGMAYCGDHIWTINRPDPPTHYRLIVGPK